MKTLALIAHDNKKVDLVAWATFNRETLAAFPLVATRHTARLVRDKVGLEVEELLSGPEGATLRSPCGSRLDRWMRCSFSSIHFRRSRTIPTFARCSGCAMCTTSRSRRILPPPIS